MKYKDNDNNSNLPTQNSNKLEKLKNNKIIESKRNYYEDHEIKYLNKEELITLFKYLRARDTFYLLFCLFLYETASRYGEAVRAKFCDLDNFTGKIRLTNLKQKMTSKNKFKVIVISNELKNLILSHYIYLKELSPSINMNDFILIKKPNRKPPTEQGVNKQLKIYFREALGENYVDRAHTHVFRHSKAISLLETSGNIMQVKLLLGHKFLSNTAIYLQYSNPDLFKVLNQDNDDFYSRFQL